MNRLSLDLPRKTAADLRALLEPVGAYIAAVDTFAQQKAAVIAALIILIESVQQINGIADACLETSSQNHIG
jgi:hypothetical protein